MQHVHMSQQDFANRLGISAASLSSIFTGRTNPTNNHVMAIHHAFPEINVNWLLFGEGDMIASKVPEETNDEGKSGEPSAAHASGSPEAMLPSQQSGSLFDQPVPAASAAVHPEPYVAYGQRRETGTYPKRGNELVGSVINVDKRTRKIKEIRVFFDDGTYESFVPSGK